MLISTLIDGRTGDGDAEGTIYDHSANQIAFLASVHMVQLRTGGGGADTCTC